VEIKSENNNFLVNQLFGRILMKVEVDEQTRKQLEQELWGDSCPECNSWTKPEISCYQLKKDEAFIITCPECQFTIVVVDVEKHSAEVIPQM
jgi:hypothetical protein